MEKPSSGRSKQYRLCYAEVTDPIQGAMNHDEEQTRVLIEIRDLLRKHVAGAAEYPRPRRLGETFQSLARCSSICQFRSRGGVLRRLAVALCTIALVVGAFFLKTVEGTLRIETN